MFCRVSIFYLLYLIEILHQTTTTEQHTTSIWRCILSKFYIKPQQLCLLNWWISVVSYRNSTSNHNCETKRDCSIPVVSYRNSTSNHNSHSRAPASSLLYLIEILHQTTTIPGGWVPGNSLYLIEILHQTTTVLLGIKYWIELYLIEILHQTTTYPARSVLLRGCILSKFYIKPQPTVLLMEARSSCILSKFYIKPQHNGGPHWRGIRCILSKFYIKPQPWLCSWIFHKVVSYRNSTSNHNCSPRCWLPWSLYLIEILHQTTTFAVICISVPRCILSKFYIKPQRIPYIELHLSVVSYRNSTSNHNSRGSLYSSSALYLIEILHQTTTKDGQPRTTDCCILSKFYIKPQHWRQKYWRWRSCILSKFYIKPQHGFCFNVRRFVVSYRNSTSNHNFLLSAIAYSKLYLIEILHQTTTFSRFCLHGPQVVSYRNSTSNHNEFGCACGRKCVVSYRNSTSNHNENGILLNRDTVVSYRNSTSNHNAAVVF